MKELRYEEYLSILRDRSVSERILISVTFELTYRCNLRCRPCYVVEKRDKREISTKEVLGILDQLKDSGTLHIYFTGGEIFLRDDILEILTHAKRLGFQMKLFTNGTLITEEMTNRLIKLDINRFEISFFGATKETFDKITQVRGSYERTLDCIKILIQKGGYVTMKILVVKKNLDEVKKMLEMADNIGVSSLYSDLILPKRYGCKEEAMCHQISPQDFIRLARKITGETHKDVTQTQMDAKTECTKAISCESTADKYKSRESSSIDSLFGCIAGNELACINPYGEMNVCVGFPFPSYDVLRGGVKRGWEEVKKFVDEARAPGDWKCRSCELWNFCTSCPVWAYLYTGSMSGCPDYFKELAKLYKEKSER